ncbi:MAG: hypothetical protein U0L72_02915 [Acutalibacteraceae bacterium]|nr:hypothetical protein [Acutalibacteraceae bacterium]
MDKDKLLAVIKEHGERQEDLANAIGISRTRLSAKIHGRDNASFTQPEIAAIKKHYALSAVAVNEIFFN